MVSRDPPVCAAHACPSAMPPSLAGAARASSTRGRRAAKLAPQAVRKDARSRSSRRPGATVASPFARRRHPAPTRPGPRRGSRGRAPRRSAASPRAGEALGERQQVQRAVRARCATATRSASTGPMRGGERLQLHRRLPLEGRSPRARPAAPPRHRTSGRPRWSRGEFVPLLEHLAHDGGARHARSALRDLVAAPERVQHGRPPCARARARRGRRRAGAGAPRWPSRVEARAVHAQQLAAPGRAVGAQPDAVEREADARARRGRAPRTPPRCARGGAGRRTRECRARPANRAAKRLE